jgi:hypothetical protein
MYYNTALAFSDGRSQREQRKLQEEMKKLQDSVCMDQNQLNALLVERGFRMSTGPLPQDRFTVNPVTEESCANAAIIELHSEAELQRLVDLIRSMGTVSGSLVLWESDRTTHDQRAAERMYGMAHDQAVRLAALDGQKIGRMLNAVERKADFDGLEAAALYGEYNYHYDPNEGLRSMTFRFALVD